MDIRDGLGRSLYRRLHWARRLLNILEVRFGCDVADKYKTSYEQYYINHTVDECVTFVTYREKTRQRRTSRNALRDRYPAKIGPPMMGSTPDKVR